MGRYDRGKDFATVVLTQRTWAGVFMGQLSHLYAMVWERNKWEEGSTNWNYHQDNIREAINTFMPVLKEACMIDSSVDREWFEFKLAAGIFPMDSLVDNAKKLVHIVPAA